MEGWRGKRCTGPAPMMRASWPWSWASLHSDGEHWAGVSRESALHTAVGTVGAGMGVVALGCCASLKGGIAGGRSSALSLQRGSWALKDTQRLLQRLVEGGGHSR